MDGDTEEPSSQRRRPRDDAGRRGAGAASTSPGTPGITRNGPKLGETAKEASLSLRTGHGLSTPRFLTSSFQNSLTSRGIETQRYDREGPVIVSLPGKEIKCHKIGSLVRKQNKTFFLDFTTDVWWLRHEEKRTFVFSFLLNVL